jgi:hypothetical protein
MPAPTMFPLNRVVAMGEEDELALVAQPLLKGPQNLRG